MLAIVPVILNCSSLCAQPVEPNGVKDTLLKGAYERKTIYLSGNNNVYIKNKARTRMGLFGGKIRKEFDSCSLESKAEMVFFVKKKKRGVILMGAGVVAAVGSFFIMPVVIGPVIAGLGAVGLPACIIGALNLHSAQNHLHKAVWLRNRDVILVPKN